MNWATSVLNMSLNGLYLPVPLHWCFWHCWVSSKVAFLVDAGLGIAPDLASNAVALVLFALTLPIFTFFLSPLLFMGSRKHEFEADDFSARHTDAGHLVSALVKMYEDNASTLTPQPLHSSIL